MPSTDKHKHIAWATVAGGLIVAILGAIVVNFVILPIRENIKARSAMALTVHDLDLRVASMEKWQNDMQKWKERMIATTGVSMRRAIATMPAPQPVDTTE